MLDKETTKKLCDELATHFGCHTVILYGSHAQGEARQTSDYDVLGVRPSGDVVRDARPWNGTYLDAFIYPEDKLLQVDETMIRMRDGVVLKQKENIGSQFLERLDEIFKKGPKQLPEDEILARKVWWEKMLARAKQGDPEGDFRRHWLLTDILEDYFLVRGQWYLGPKESIRWLKENESHLYTAYIESLKPGADISTLERLVALMIKAVSPQFKIERVDAKAAPLIQKILDATPRYSMNTEGVTIDPNGATDTLTALPPNCGPEQKYVFLLRNHGRPVGVADLIYGYPQPNKAFLGLILVREDQQRQGLGKSFYQLIEKFATDELSCKAIRLAVVDSNPVVPFWEKMGFKMTGENAPHHGQKISSTKRVMEKEIRSNLQRSQPILLVKRF